LPLKYGGRLLFVLHGIAAEAKQLLLVEVFSESSEQLAQGVIGDGWRLLFLPSLEFKWP
jgi:hypothetical protein